MIAAAVVPAMTVAVKHYEIGAFVAEPMVLQSEMMDLSSTPHGILPFSSETEIQSQVDKEKLADVIQQLGSLIVDRDTGVQELLGSEESLLLAAGFSSELKQMTKALDDYDFDTAMAVLRVIAESRDVQL